MRAIAGAVLFVVLALAAWMLLRSPDEPASAQVPEPACDVDQTGVGSAIR